MVAVEDVICIEANSGAVKRVSRSDAFATKFDLEADEHVPLPKGEVHKKKRNSSGTSFISSGCFALFYWIYSRYLCKIAL